MKTSLFFNNPKNMNDIQRQRLSLSKDFMYYLKHAYMSALPDIKCEAQTELKIKAKINVN